MTELIENGDMPVYVLICAGLAIAQGIFAIFENYLIATVLLIIFALCLVPLVIATKKWYESEDAA